MTDREAFTALLRTDMHSFIWKVFQTILPGECYLRNWHVDAIVYQLLEVEAGRITRLIINQPPRSMKSLCVSVAYVAWLLGHDPSRRIMVVSYSTELASELHRQFRMLIDAPWYRAAFPRMRPKKDTGLELVTTAGGSRYAASVGGTLTGRGADLIIVDEPLKVEDAMSDLGRRRVNEWIGSTLVSRLNDKKRGAILVVMQRLHEDDLAGHLLEQGNWQNLILPAIAEEDTLVQVGTDDFRLRRAGEALHPDRESRAVLEQTRAEMGSVTFAAQYQQQPVALVGNLIRREWLRFYDQPPQGALDHIAQSWDVAMMTGESNDYSVCTTWWMIGSDYYLIDLFHGRLQYPDLRRQIAKLAELHRADTVLIENAGPGMALLQDIRRDLPPGMPLPIGQKPDGSKVERMIAESAWIEAGHVHLPRHAPWRDALLHEWLAFPRGRHDDRVDSISQFLRWASKQRYYNMHAMSVGLPYVG